MVGPTNGSGSGRRGGGQLLAMDALSGLLAMPEVGSLGSARMYTLSPLLNLPLLQELAHLGRKLAVVGLASPSPSAAPRRSSGSSSGLETLLRSSLVSGLQRPMTGLTSPCRPALRQLGGPDGEG